MDHNFKDLQNAVEFYEKAKNEINITTYGAYKDAVEWVLESSVRFVKESENEQTDPS